MTDGVTAGKAVNLERMICNLLDNACRHARAHVTVIVRPCPDRTNGTPDALLEVADDGAGNPAADRERVFERFTRLDEARTRDGGGSGLGLPIARAIAAEHGGSLCAAETTSGALLIARLPRTDHGGREHG